jgi:hypothetical protein
MPRDFFSNVTLKSYFVLAFCMLAPVRTLAAPSPTTTALAVFPGGNVAAGTLLNLKASVSSTGQAVSPGLVLFCNADAGYCEDLNILGQAQLTRDGSASLNLILPIGVHNIRAEFRGTKLYAASSSSLQNVTVGTGYLTTTALSAVQTLSQFTLTATVSSFRPTFPAGSVLFRDTANNNLSLVQGTLNPSSFNYFAVPNSTASYSLTSAAVADVNGDGNLDQIALSPAYNQAAILFGKGDGTFTTGPAIYTGKTPHSVAVGDFNNDNIPDFAVTNSGDGTVSIFLGAGDGTFTTTAAIPVGTNPTNISVGDFNNDGNADLAVSSSLGVTILVGNGSGSFTPISTLLAVPNATTLRVSDLNGDGIADLIFTNSQSVYVFLGNGDGTFTATPPSVTCTGGCVDVLVADFNGDGIPDLAVADPGDGILVFLPGIGNGTFGAEIDSRTEDPQTLALGDFNGDGTPDIASIVLGTEKYPTLVGIWTNNGQGYFPNFGFISYGSSFATSFSTVGDFTNSGVTGLVLGVSGPVVEPQWQSTATGSGATLSGSLGIHNVFADYQGDQSDLASQSGTVALQGPQVTTAVALDVTPLPISPGHPVSIVATISPSIVDGYHPGGTVSFYNGVRFLATRSVSFATAQAIYTTADPLVSEKGTYLHATYSGDTRFLGSSTAAPVRLTTAGALRPASITSLEVSPSSEVAPGTVVTLSASIANGEVPVFPGLVLFYGRVPANSRETLLGQAQLTQSGVATIKLRFGNGSHSIRAAFLGTNTVAQSSSPIQDLTVAGTPLPTGAGTSYSLTPALPPFVHTQQTAVAVGDFNNDGILDIAMTDESSNLNILLGNPDGTFYQKPPIPLAHYGYNSTLVVADFNSDGKPDIAVLQTADTEAGPAGVLFILMGSGDGSFRTELSMAVPIPTSMAEGDFNGDGIPDLVTTNADGSVSILLGTGFGRFEGARTVALGAALYESVFVADLNGDDIPDIATTVQNSSNPIGLLLGKGDGTFVTTDLPGTAGCGALLAVADFNGDGYQDLAVACSGGLTVFLGYGNGAFLSTTTPDEPTGDSAVVADMNGDGIPDLVLTNEAFSDVVVSLGEGDGTFLYGVGAAVTVPASGFAVQSAVGDFNGDGIPDVITAVENGYPWEQTGPVDRMGEWFGTITPVSP